MANGILIVGDTGVGKTTSLFGNKEFNIKGLDPKETFIINVKGKALPAKGWKNLYKSIDPTKPPTEGNYLATTDSALIVKIIQYVSANRTDIKHIVVDDYQYIMSEQFMAKALEPGYDKFNRLAKNAYDVLNAGINARDDINFIILSHDDEENGKSKLRTLGRMLDDKINPIGLFTYALFGTSKTKLSGGSTYHFITNRTIDDRGILIPAKTPPGLFSELLIPNDLGHVVEEINKYNNN